MSDAFMLTEEKKFALLGYRDDQPIYRYVLTRRWDDGDIVNFIMLNPSTADAYSDDQTIKVIRNFAKLWGFSGLVVTNLFAFRSTDPAALRLESDPIGPDNDMHIRDRAATAKLHVAASGAGGGLMNRDKRVLADLADAGHRPMALKITKWGDPHHPLRLPMSIKPVPIPGVRYV